jgi:hypothetical protein
VPQVLQVSHVPPQLGQHVQQQLQPSQVLSHVPSQLATIVSNWPCTVPFRATTLAGVVSNESMRSASRSSFSFFIAAPVEGPIGLRGASRAIGHGVAAPAGRLLFDGPVAALRRGPVHTLPNELPCHQSGQVLVQSHVPPHDQSHVPLHELSHVQQLQHAASHVHCPGQVPQLV